MASNVHLWAYEELGVVPCPHNNERAEQTENQQLPLGSSER